MRYRTREGDMVDAICHRVYGAAGGWTELVLEANPGLADEEPVLPSGLVIDLPDPPTAPVRKDEIRLWS